VRCFPVSAKVIIQAIQALGHQYMTIFGYQTVAPVGKIRPFFLHLSPVAEKIY
jgi:hypothetical protein